MTAFAITCAAGHAQKTVALVADLMGWDVNPPEADMARRRQPVDGYSFRCPCGVGVAVDKEELHWVLTEAHRLEGYTALSLQVLAKARSWHHGLHKPEPIHEHERTT